MKIARTEETALLGVIAVDLVTVILLDAVDMMMKTAAEAIDHTATVIVTENVGETAMEIENGAEIGIAITTRTATETAVTVIATTGRAAPAIRLIRLDTIVSPIAAAGLIEDQIISWPRHGIVYYIIRTNWMRPGECASKPFRSRTTSLLC